MMAFVFGTFGVHKFYLGEGGKGVFYIMLFAMTSRFFPISTILGMIDGIRYLTMSEKEFNRKYNSARSERVSRRSERRRQRRRQKEYYEYEPAPRHRRTQKRKEGRVRPNPFKKSGLKKYKDYDIEEAITDFEKGLKLQPNDIALHFNLACAYSLLENAEKAFYHVNKCMENGFSDTNKILTHEDLAYMRIQPEFDAFKENGFKEEKKVKKEDPKEVTDELLLEKLRKLVEMRRRGIVTESDFKIEREKILHKA